MVKTKYGIKVPLAVDDYIWVTHLPTGANDFDLNPVLYDTAEEAETAAEIWDQWQKSNLLWLTLTKTVLH